MPQPRAYLAGPDVFLPHAATMARAKAEICARHGLEGVSPFNPDLDLTAPPDALWRHIFLDDVALMLGCDLIIANLTPFRGASADAGTLVELGWFYARGRPAFGYSNSADDFATRSRAQMARSPDPLPGLAVEAFGLHDNLMIPGVLTYGGGTKLHTPSDGISRAFDSLEIFELCVAAAAASLTG